MTDVPRGAAGESSRRAPAIVLRASITAEEWTALRAAAIRMDSTVQAIVGSLISDYLWANGYIGSEQTGR